MGLFRDIILSDSEVLKQTYVAPFFICLSGDSVEAATPPTLVIMDAKYDSSIKDLTSSNKLYKKFVQYLKGSVFNEEDLSRCYTNISSVSDTIFIYSDTEGKDSDEDTIMRVLFMKLKFPLITPKVVVRSSTCLEILETVQLSASDVCCIDTIKFGLIAQNTVAPGTSTLIENLVRSYKLHGRSNTNSFRTF